ncbi:aspartate kinase [Aureivirga sp. CE67]|uniref:aspartate kinase n=1 Tax=Aureivirga sp. CE67 TaxID=1788983 RepID=UPI0018C8FCF6|nr:aspartate kinase [Aureivirga sp. CE67]
MKVYKFGGASVKDADSVRNVGRILQHEGYENTLIVISAMGKMTNAFENIIDSYYYQKPSLKDAIDFVYQYHATIIEDLFEDSKDVLFEVNCLFGSLGIFMGNNTSKDYDFIYDQIICFGELLSTKIVSFYLNEIGVDNNWLDVRNYIKTDMYYRDAKVDFKLTQKNIQDIDRKSLNIAQGFIGGTDSNITTSLGREGSDYTAAIFAYCMDADSVTIWKDVEGVLNANPQYFEETSLLESISYKEAIEMAFYGASVIHPKTLKPLENKLIPLHVRSFINLEKKGTIVRKGTDIVPKIPCFILKKKQYLVSISKTDFSFMVEESIGEVFHLFHKHKVKVNLIQNSALSFSVCLEDSFENFEELLSDLQLKYNVTYNENVSLFTIRHFTQNSIETIEKENTVLLKQMSKKTLQIIVK